MIKPITEKEWCEYDWLELTGMVERLNGQVVCARGIKKVPPPNDGFHYIEITTYTDTEQKWARAVEIVEGE
jgi:hypothetical protein